MDFKKIQHAKIKVKLDNYFKEDYLVYFVNFIKDNFVDFMTNNFVNSKIDNSFNFVVNNLVNLSFTIDYFMPSLLDNLVN